MKVRTRIVCVASLAVVAVNVGGCTVSRKEYLNTAYGPGETPATYRVGGVAPDPSTGSRVTLIRSAEVSSGWTGAASAPAASQPTTP